MKIRQIEAVGVGLSLHIFEQHLLAPAIIKLRRAAIGVAGDGLSGFKPSDLLSNCLGNNRAGNGRISFLEILEERRQRTESCSILTADAKGAFLTSATSFHLDLRLLQFPKNFFTPLQQCVVPAGVNST